MKNILVVQPIHPRALALLDARADVAYRVVGEPGEDAIRLHLAEADAITLRDTPFPARLLEAAPRLKVVSRHGVGFDNVPVEACTARGIPVTVVGPVNAVAVAEQTMLLMLAAARGAVALDAATREGDFAARRRITGIELRGRTLLLVGYGRIGREVATRALAFGLRVQVFDPHLDAAPSAPIEQAPSLAEALPQADIVSLHVPLGPETRGLLGAREIAALPQGAIVVNASRGGLVDEDALLAAIRSGHLHGAGLDTFATEPLPASSPLLAERRIVLSPHSAALTEEALLGMGLATVRNALAGLDGTLDPALVVNPEVLVRT
ncbi:MAG: hydroxyacid dehydrogenase [Methylobacteriaceae bacterium]|nr:hydroxyacid dehydrogenase [Methylobacteriaceae bacterium]